MTDRMQVEMTDIQLIAAYGMTEAIRTLAPKSAVNLGQEIIREGRGIALGAEGDYELMRNMILNYIAPKLGEIAKRMDPVFVNIGYLMGSGALTLNVRAAGGVKYFLIDAQGRISEGTGESDADEDAEETKEAADQDWSWGGKW